nr:cystatin-1 [Hydra vulgaris]
MSLALAFVALLGLSLANAQLGGIVNLSQTKVTELLSENGDFAKGLKMAVTKLNNGNEKHKQVIEKIIDATSQVVAGIRYVVNVKIVESVCKSMNNNILMTTKLCPALKYSKSKICKVVIWSRRWLSLATESLVVDITC